MRPEAVAQLQPPGLPLVPLRLEPLRPLGGPGDRHGREDDDERDQDGVEELGGQNSACLAEELGKQLLDGRVPGQGRHET